MARISIFLIMVALIGGTIGCAPAPTAQYDLTISSTEGGSVTTPGEGTGSFAYDEGKVVDLVAEAEEGYHFVNWTGDVVTVADAEDATTTITMNSDYSITANFSLQLVEIGDWYDLDAIRNNLDGDCILMNSLSSTTAGYAELASPTANGGKGWQPIGAAGMPFTGSFDGHGYEIRDLFINRPDEGWVGLFGYVGDGGVIENLGAVNVEVTGGRRVGGLVGQNIPGSTVSNSYSAGSVTGYSSVGGLVGFNEGGTVSNSYASSNVTGTEGIGGLVGFNDWGTVRNSHYDYDEVLIHGENIITIGALFGADFDEWLANGKFLDVNERLSKEDSYYVINNVNDFQQLLAFGQSSSLKFRLNNDLDLATAPNLYIPYLAGEFDGDGHKISNLSFNFGVPQVGLFGYLAPGGRVAQLGVENVNISADFIVGGLVGDNRGAVSNSYSTGRVIADGAGGLVGYNVGTVSNSYSTGSVTGRYYVAGLVGYNDGGTVNNSYSNGKVNGMGYVGGLVGVNEGPVRNSFWDIETSGQTTSEGGTAGKTTAQMKSIATFSGADWNIIAVANPETRNPSYIWNIVDGETYPFLSWQSVS